MGGRTIAEARSNISYREFQYWREYRKQRGCLNIGLRLDESLSLLKLMYARANSFECSDEYDFMPYHDAPDISFEEAMKMYGAE
ncbi:hypothetical protein EGT69_009965 [Acinetobacter junii]|nr:hypothetical protein EGT69_009965 [Acinetobacter junii]